jgi:cytochrome c553
MPSCVPDRVMKILFAVSCVFLAPHATSAQTAAAIPNDAARGVACHGMHGEGAAGGVPRLAGQNAQYMSHALSMFSDLPLRGSVDD